jgi:hypothetical protein
MEGRDSLYDPAALSPGTNRCAYCIERYVGPRIDPEFVAKRKFLFYLKSNPGHPARILITVTDLSLLFLFGKAITSWVMK